MSAVNPPVDGKRNRNERATCDRCSLSYVARNYAIHINSPECVSKVNSKSAFAEGYIFAYQHYNAGHCSRAEWAKPFLKQFETGVGKIGFKSKLEKRWWAPKWWLPIAHLTKNMPPTERDKLMTQVLHWWEAGEMEQIDNMVGLIELSKAPL